MACHVPRCSSSYHRYCLCSSSISQGRNSLQDSPPVFVHACSLLGFLCSQTGSTLSNNCYRKSCSCKDQDTILAWGIACYWHGAVRISERQSNLQSKGPAGIQAPNHRTRFLPFFSTCVPCGAPRCICDVSGLEQIGYSFSKL